MKPVARTAAALAALILGLAAIRLLGAESARVKPASRSLPASFETAEIESAEIEPSIHAPPDASLDSRSVPMSRDAIEIAKFGGTVVDTATSKPLEGVLVQLFDALLPKDSVRTDSQGRFGFDRGHVGSLWLQVPVQVGFRPVGGAILVTDELRAGLVEVAFRVERVPAAPLDVRLVYPNGDPIPWLRIEICDAGGEPLVEVRSDADGNILTDRLELGTYSLTALVDPESLVVGLEHAGTDKTQITIDASPTVVARAPADVASGDSFDAYFDHPGSDSSWSVTPYPTGDGRLRAIVPERADVLRQLEGPWIVRFRLSGWCSEVEVPALDGLVEIEPRWRAQGRIELSVQCALDPVPSYPVLITLKRAGEEESTYGPRLDRLVMEPLRFEPLEPGRYELGAAVEFCREQTFVVEVERSRTARVPVDLDCAPPVGFVEIRIATRTGAPPPGDVEASVRDLDSGECHFRGHLDLGHVSPDQLGHDTIRLGPVPSGRYTASVEATPWRVEPKSFVVQADGVATFTILDDVPRSNIVATAVDADSGKEIEGAIVTLDLHRTGSYRYDAGPELRDVPSHALVYMGAGAEGYRSAAKWTSLDAVDLLDRGDHKLWRIPLKRGWNAYVQVYEEDSDEPIAGAVILADGVEVGRTDENGLAEIVLDRAPRAVEARSPGRALELLEPPTSPFHCFEFVVRR